MKTVKVKSNADGKTRFDFEMKLDIQKNKPVIMKKQETPSTEQGLSVSIVLDGDYAKAGTKIRDYVYQTSLITPYATISFDDPIVTELVPFRIFYKAELAHHDYYNLNPSQPYCLAVISPKLKKLFKSHTQLLKEEL